MIVTELLSHIIKAQEEHKKKIDEVWNDIIRKDKILVSYVDVMGSKHIKQDQV